MNNAPHTNTAAFMAAVDHGDLARVRNFLKSGTPVDTAGEDGATGLIRAAARGHLGLVDEFLDAGADVNRADHHGHTALIEAARRGHPDVVRSLLHAGAEMTIDVNRNEYNAVLYALDGGHEGIADLLNKAAAPRSIPLLRGIESFDLHARWVAVRDPIERVTEAFAARRGVQLRRDVFGREVRLTAASYLALQFRAHGWTLITELHVEDPARRLAPDDAEALAQILSQRTYFFETSDQAGRFRYQCFHALQCLEDFDTGRPGPMVASSRRKVNEAELVNPEAFASRFAALQGIFIPAFEPGTGKTGEEGLMRLPGYLKSDFERVDFLG